MLSCGLSGKGSATTTTLSRSTAVTMIRDTDWDILQTGLQYIADMHFLSLTGMANIHVEHLVEITIVHITLPVDAELIGTH